jgi:hypothetical protein
MFWCYRVLGFFDEGSSKTPYKTFYKKSMSNLFFTKKSTKIQCRFVLDLFLAFLGVSRQGEFEKPMKKWGEMSGLITFLASDPPTHHGGVRFFLAAP